MHLTQEELSQISGLREDVKSLMKDISNNKNILDDGLINDLKYDEEILYEILKENNYCK